MIEHKDNRRPIYGVLTEPLRGDMKKEDLNKPDETKFSNWKPGSKDPEDEKEDIEIK